MDYLLKIRPNQGSNPWTLDHEQHIPCPRYVHPNYSAISDTICELAKLSIKYYLLGSLVICSNILISYMLFVH